MPSIIKTVTLAPGETFTLPPGATIIHTSSHESLSSTCDELPETSEMKCYRLLFSVNVNRTPSPALEHDDTIVSAIFISGVQYDLNEANEDNVIAAINAVVPGVLSNLALVGSSTGDRYVKSYTFQAPEVVGETVELKITGPGFDDGLYVKAVEFEC
jgi:hypothetical protein